MGNTEITVSVTDYMSSDRKFSDNLSAFKYKDEMYEYLCQVVRGQFNEFKVFNFHTDMSFSNNANANKSFKEYLKDHGNYVRTYICIRKSDFVKGESIADILEQFKADMAGKTIEIRVLVLTDSWYDGLTSLGDPSEWNDKVLFRGQLLSGDENEQELSLYDCENETFVSSTGVPIENNRTR